MQRHIEAMECRSTTFLISGLARNLSEHSARGGRNQPHRREMVLGLVWLGSGPCQYGCRTQ